MIEQTTLTDASSATILASIRFDANGLVPAIAQQHDTGEVLMMAWMNAEAVRETLATRRVCYFSRSRGALWRKGETSGQSQHLQELRIDCDGDTLLVLVQQDGVACHTGRRNCFYRAARGGELVEIAAPLISPDSLYGNRADAHAAGQHGTGPSEPDQPDAAQSSARHATVGHPRRDLEHGPTGLLAQRQDRPANGHPDDPQAGSGHGPAGQPGSRHG